MTTSSSPVQLHELHPVEQLLALLLTSAAALHRLFSEPPRVIRQKPAPFVRRDITHAVSFAVETTAGRAPDEIQNINPNEIRNMAMQVARQAIKQNTIPIASASASHTIRELQQMARERGIRSVDGRPLKYCKKARLVEVLSNG
jgi:hypothetical protein